MEVLFYYVIDSLLLFLFISLTQISPVSLIRVSKEFLKAGNFTKSYIANIVSIFLMIFTLSIILGLFFGEVHNPLVLAALIMFTPLVGTTIYFIAHFVSSTLVLENYYRYFPSYEITRSLMYLNFAALLGLCFYVQDYEQTYALYGDDMDKILEIHSNCGDGPRCIGIEYNIFYNTKVTSEVLEEVVRRNPVSGIACRAMENPNATEEQIRRWSDMGWAFKRCADRILESRRFK